MKKYTLEDLEEALEFLKTIQDWNDVIEDYKNKVTAELKKRNTPKLIKATNEYLETLAYDDVYTRLLVETDDHYYPSMYGLFEKKTGKLLRRHTDTGYLLLPEIKREIGWKRFPFTN